MKISVILTAATLAFGSAAFAETPEMQRQDNYNATHSARRADDGTTAGHKLRNATKRAADKTRNAMHRMRDSMHRDTARRDRDADDTRAMGASRGDHMRGDMRDHMGRDDHMRGSDHMRGNEYMRGSDRTREDADEARRSRMDDAYANWRSRQQR